MYKAKEKKKKELYPLASDPVQTCLRWDHDFEFVLDWLRSDEACKLLWWRLLFLEFVSSFQVIWWWIADVLRFLVLWDCCGYVIDLKDGSMCRLLLDVVRVWDVIFACKNRVLW